MTQNHIIMPYVNGHKIPNGVHRSPHILNILERRYHAQFYESIAAPANGRIDVKLFWKPLVTLIWIGAIVMAFGGVLSLSDRRLRFGIAARARRAAPVAAVPAE